MNNLLNIGNQILANNLSNIGLISMNANNIINDSTINGSITTINNDNLINQLNQSSKKVKIII